MKLGDVQDCNVAAVLSACKSEKLGGFFSTRTDLDPRFLVVMSSLFT